MDGQITTATACVVLCIALHV